MIRLSEKDVVDEFKVGFVYEGGGVYGEEQVLIVSKTAKTITIKPKNQNKIFRVKLTNFKDKESFSFKAWLFNDPNKHIVL